MPHRKAESSVLIAGRLSHLDLKLPFSEFQPFRAEEGRGSRTARDEWTWSEGHETSAANARKPASVNIRAGASTS